MNNIIITKSIAGAAVAFALAACSSEDAVTVEEPGEVSEQIRYEPLYGSELPPSVVMVSAETEETLEIWLAGNELSKSIMVDRWCVANPDYPDNSWWCYPARIQLESGTVFNTYGGLSDGIVCETSRDTLFYATFLSGDTVTKRLSLNLADYNPYAMDEFRDSCETEGGTAMEDNEGALACTLKIGACDSEHCQNSPEPKYFYTDPNWRLFAVMATAPCRMSPVN